MAAERRVRCHAVDLDRAALDIRLRKRAEEIVGFSAAVEIPYCANTCGKSAPMCCGPMAERSPPEI
jgi:hypothetical protein